MKLDSDLQSIQEVRDLLQAARAAQKKLEKMTQAEIDGIVENMAMRAVQEAKRLAELAVQETGFGKVADKTVKNLFVAKEVFEAIKPMKTVGIIHRDDIRKVWEVAQPVGIVAGIVPSTNPTSTVIFKSMIAVKSRNAIVFSPHPAALQCSLQSAIAMQAAAVQAGAPEGLIGCISSPSMAATNELMTNKLTGVILATGGTPMVKAAYSSGKPAYGVGPGNVPVYIHSSAVIHEAVRHIIASKTFDYGTICASEQAIVVDYAIKPQFVQELVHQGAYMLNDSEKEKVSAVIMAGNGLNPKIVGKSPQIIAEMAGIRIPEQTKVLVAEESNIGKSYPFSIEKLSPILALYTSRNWEEGCDICIELLELGGLGHTLGIHSEDMSVIEAFALEKPASRIIVNSGTTFGAIGASTNIFPSMTLGCGSFGNNITSDNIGPQHLLNIKRIAFGVKDVEQQYATELSSAAAKQFAGDASRVQGGQRLDQVPGITREDVIDIVKRVLSEFKN